MFKAVAVRIYYRTKKGSSEMIEKKLETSDVELIKQVIAAEVKRIVKRIEYYYVVMVVRRPDRRLGYRTIIPKQVM